MSLYRRPGRVGARVLVSAAAAALLVGLLTGFALGRTTSSEPTLAEQIAALRTQLGPAQSGLELTATEYGQAVRDGRVIARTEYDAARADVARVQDTLAATRADLRALDRPGADRLDAAVTRVEESVRSRAEVTEVRSRVRSALQTLRDVSGG